MYRLCAGKLFDVRSGLCDDNLSASVWLGHRAAIGDLHDVSAGGARRGMRLVQFVQSLRVVQHVRSYSPCVSCPGNCATGSRGVPVPTCGTCQPAVAVPAAAATVVPAAPVAAAPAAPAAVAPGPYYDAGQTPATPASTPGVGAPTTFQENKPSTETQHLTPIPEQPGVKFNSAPLPLLPKPGDRTASRAVYTTARVQLIAAPAARSAVTDDGWQPANE